jgi:hypothetical protein
MPVKCCKGVSALEGMMFPATRAPKLPMTDCTMPDQCHCKFKKYIDRHDDDQGRRFRYGQESGAWYASGQRRKAPGRKTAD